MLHKIHFSEGFTFPLDSRILEFHFSEGKYLLNWLNHGISEAFVSLAVDTRNPGAFWGR